ncbi:MAG: tRNA-dihydrouridine synthase A [Candidatus Azotimanducaceae bacterium]|jgi:tRNA-dihydrouridine synthase A
MIKNDLEQKTPPASQNKAMHESKGLQIDRTISVAPMMGYTDRHARVLFRLIAPHSLLFTEMVVASALLRGDRNRFLAHGLDAPCALQLGGSDPSELAECSVIAADAGYQEVNLNVGCPSDRVQQGAIGACLMADPELVGDCVAAMQAATDIPVTVKCRIGIDDQDSYEAFSNFVSIVSQKGCRIFYVHARKAILKGLSPKENREIPPLKYDYVRRIQQDFPNLSFYLNGGIDSVDTAVTQLQTFPGVMMGRAPYKDPYLLAELESVLYGSELPSRLDIIHRYLEYGRSQKDAPRHLLKHLLGMYAGCTGARHFRRTMSGAMTDKNVSLDLVYDALQQAGIEPSTKLAANS